MMPSTTAKGSVATVASDPITKAVRMLLRAWYSTSLPVVSVPSTWYPPINDETTPISRASTTVAHSAARQGISPSLRHTLAAASLRVDWRLRARQANSIPASAMASKAPKPKPRATRFNTSCRHCRPGSAR